MRNKISAKITGLTALAATIIATTSFAQSEPVYSVNIIGMQKQSLVEDLQMMSNPFEAMTIRELVGNSGVYGSDQSVADNFILYDADTQSYQTYYLRSASSIGYPEWRRGTSWATNVLVQPNQGFFYRSRSATTRTNVVVGDVVLAEAVTNTITPGLQLLSYPYSTAVRLSDINLKSGAYGADQSIADNVVLFDSASKSYLTYYLRSASSIGYPEWRRGTSWATNVVIEPGQAFFFRSRSNEAYNWVESTPYPGL